MKEIFFSLQPIQTNAMDEHTNAYAVQTVLTARNVVVPLKDLFTHKPVQELTFDAEEFIILRRSIQAMM